MNGEAHPKVTNAHLSRLAYLYARQSTLRQVFENTESTHRQYALRERAVALGWPLDRIVVIDSDLGQSGASAADRSGGTVRACRYVNPRQSRKSSEEMSSTWKGHELAAGELGHTDTDQTTCLHVPSIGLVVAGDAAYNDDHLYLAESNPQKREEWIAALDKIESLNPRAIVASHQSAGQGRQSQDYRRDAAVHPRFRPSGGGDENGSRTLRQDAGTLSDRVNPGWALWSSARSVKSPCCRVC